MTSRKIPESAVENLVSDLEGKANVSLSNLSAAGQAKFDAKANVSNTVTTNTAQTITGFKAFNSGSGNNRTNIDIITNDGVAEDANTKWAGSIQFKKGNLDVGFCEAMRDNKNSSIAQIVAHNSVNGQEVYASLRSVVTSDGTIFGTAPNTPANAPANAIVTKDKIANMVTTNTAQTISGSKQFTKTMGIQFVADTNQQTVPATATVRQLGLYRNATYTKGDGYTCWLQGHRGSDGHTGGALYTRRFLESDSQEIINYLQANITPDGTPISYTRTPPVFCTGEEIVTAGWFNSKMQVVSALPANPNPNVFYFIPE